MSVFAKLFGKKSSGSSAAASGEIDLEPPPPLAFDKSIVRLVIFQERCTGRVPLYDSKSIEKIPDLPSTPGKASESRSRWTRGCRLAESSSASLPPTVTPPNVPADPLSKSKSLPPAQTPPPTGQTVPMIAASGGVRYRLSKPPSDIKMLAEMAFGSLPMKSLGVDFKVHEIKNPHQIMMSQVFHLISNKDQNSLRGSRERYTNPSPSYQPSTPMGSSLQNKTNSRFYLHLSALDAAVDAPPPPCAANSSGLPCSTRQCLNPGSSRRCDGYLTSSSAIPSAAFCTSASHGNLRGSSTLKMTVDGAIPKSSPSAALVVGDDGDALGKFSARTLTDANAGSRDPPLQMARSKPVDVPVFHLNTPNDDPPSLSSSTGSSCISSPSRHSYQSQISRHRNPRRLVHSAASSHGGSSEWRGFSPGGSTSGSSVSSCLSGSYASIHKRWMRNQAKSLEFAGRTERAKDTFGFDGSLGLDGSRHRPDLGDVFKGLGTSTRKEPSTKLAFSLVFDMEAPSLSGSSPSSSYLATERHQRATSVLKTFFFTHASLIESHIRALRDDVQTAFLGNKKDFLHLVTVALDALRDRIDELIVSSRLPHPLWLRLTASSSAERVDNHDSKRFVFSSSSTSSADSDSDGSLQHQHLLRKNGLCLAFLRKFSQTVDRLDTKHSNYFFSSLLTAVLTHHLAWVTTVSPSSSTSRGNYLQKKLAPWLDNWAVCGSYNPLWGQLGDLFGAVTFPLKVSQTVVVGSKKEVVKDLLFILSYFIRCSDVVISRNASFATDFWDQSINQLLLQESIISTKSGDTIVDVVPGLANADIEDATKSLELTVDEPSSSPYFGFHDDGDDDDSSPMFRPRSNTVLERKAAAAVAAAKRARHGPSRNQDPAAPQSSCDDHSSRSESVNVIESSRSGRANPGFLEADGNGANLSVNDGISRKDSGVLLDGDSRRSNERDDGPSLMDSGCFDSLNGCGNRDSSRQPRLNHERKTSVTQPGKESMAVVTTQNDLNQHVQNQERSNHPLDSSRKMSSSPSTSATLPLPSGSQHRSKTHSMDSQYSSKTSSTCHSDEGFDSIPSEATSKDGSPPSLSEAPRSAKANADFGTKGLVDIMDPSTFSVLNESTAASDLRSRYASSKVNANSASLSDLDATEVPHLLFADDVAADFQNSFDASRGPNESADSISSNLGFSLLGGVHSSFRPDFALQGTQDRDFTATLPQHLRRQLEQSFLDDRVTASSCIVADVDRCVVEVYSTEHSDPTTPALVTPANMVVGVAESLRDLFKVSSSSSSTSLSSSPELCLAHLEDKLQEIYFKSLTFSQILPTLQQWRGKDRNELRSLVGFEMSDVPLLTAVASTHEDNVHF